MTGPIEKPKRVSLFVTCLVDALFPRVGIATVNLLQRLGVAVDFPADPVCCGQPAFNSGYRDQARAVARPLLRAFERSECVVCPSGSCTAMIRNYFPDLFADDEREASLASELAGKTYELSEFLVRVAGIADTRSAFEGSVAYHPSCHLQRELGVTDPPRRLLGAVKGVELVKLEHSEECCGFGGTFAVKHAPLSGEMVRGKVDAIVASGAHAVVSCDTGCLMNIGGALRKQGSPVRALHLAEVLEAAR